MTEPIKIIQETKSTAVEAKVLGQRVSAPDVYCPAILVRVPRIENRQQYNIDENNLPFHGFDVWNAYEVSCLTNKGLPIFCQAKIVYSCTSKYIVESKSLKLYLNSFNMMKYGDDAKTAKHIITDMIRKDLSALLETDVQVYLHDTEYNIPIFSKYRSIDSWIKNLDEIEFTHFKESPDILRLDFNAPFEVNVAFPMLRSNCKITHQPDWGTAFIHIATNTINVELESLARYLVSFRGENHFHEEVCEMIYKRLYDLISSSNSKFELAVSCIYTRRGGIDICPTRYNKTYLVDTNLISPDVHCAKLLNQ